MVKRLVVLASVFLALFGVLSLPGGPAAAAPTSHGSTWSSATIPLANGGVAYDNVRDTLLVSVSPTVPTLGNHLVEMSPHTGALGRSVVVGASPRSIAVAGDASRAYVALSGSSTVTEVDLASFTVTRHINLGTSGFLGPRFAEDIEVQPGHPDVIAVSMRNACCSPRHEGVAIFDDGVQRPNITPGHTGSDRIAWSADPAVIYGYNNETTGFGTYTLTVNGSGVVVANTTSNLISGFGVDIEFGDGLLHTTSGLAVNPVTMTSAGTYQSSGAIEVDAAQHKMFMLSGTTLRRFDITTKLSDWDLAVPNISARDLVDAEDALVAGSESSILLMGPGVDKSGFALPPAPATVVQTWNAHTANLAAYDLVPSPDGAHVYGVVRATAAARPGQVVEVDTQTGAIGRSLVVGNDPHRIAISDDGSTLMIGHNTANKMTEVDVATFTVSHSITLPNDEWVSDLAARPGAPHSFAAVVVNHCCSPALEGTILVQDGVIAPNRGPDHTGATAITFAGDATRLYGHNGGTTEFGFSTMAVDNTGITVLSVDERVFQSFGLDLVASEGLVYASNGAVADPLIPLAVGSVPAAGLPVPVPAENRLLMVNGSTIAEFELDSYGAVTSQSTGAGSATDAELAGDTIAIATASQIVFVPLGPDTRTAPGAPTGVSGLPGNGQATVSWTPPSSNGGAPITTYTVVASPGGAGCQTGGTSCTVNGLTNGSPYTFTVVATNLKGSGPSSAASAPVTPVGPPAAPQGLAGTGGDASLALTWTAPVSDGGSPITGYTATTSPGGKSCSSVATGCTITGLTNGLPYTVQVRATNASGAGALSLAAGPLVPTQCDGSGAGPFPDIAADHQFCGDIEWLAANGIATGYADGDFHASSPLSRQAIAAFIYRAAGRPAFPSPVFPSFTDVGPEHPFYVEIEWMVDQHLVNGYADGSYRPSTVVSRQSLAAMLYRRAGSPAFTTPAVPTFSDVPTTHPFFKEIEWLAAEGIADGFADGSFHTTTPVSRQASAAFLHRFANR